ncbi:MFS transporter [Nonomuraea sp. NPDC050663]|uniref:MFS transporter n=1 Tax=Nonomuraea sp. NPDC050663 TaxID=3364370 RepID=UPI0037A41976
MSVLSRESTRGQVAAVCLLFLAGGLAMGAWTSRIPAIKHALALSDLQLSVGLLAMAAGGMAGMQATGPLIDRLGSHRLMIPSALALGPALLAPSLAGGLPMLVLTLFAFGGCYGVLNVSMNANAVAVEALRGRPLLSKMHAVFSIGGFLGAGSGGLLAAAGVTVTTTFLAAGSVVTAAAALTARAALRTPPAPRRQGGPAPRGVLLLGVLAFWCLVGEGAATDWSSVYLHDTLGSGPGLAAAGYAAFAVAMTAGRLAGDRLAVRLGPVRLVAGCALLAATGLGTALLAGHPAAAVAGFALFGAGLSCTVPQVFSAAGHRDPAFAGRALARVVSIGYLGFLAGPVIIGAIAEVTGLAVALAVPVAGSLVVALAAPALRR